MNMKNITSEETLFEEIPLHKMTFSTLLDGMGFYGPIVLIFIVLFELRNRPKYMWVYFIAVFANDVLNKWFKSIILEERPKNPLVFSKYETYTQVESYGMPSGHASSVGFSTMYILLVKSHSIMLPLCIFIVLVTMYQRVKYRRHTLEQVCVGLLSGSIFGWIVYTLATQWILWL